MTRRLPDDLSRTLAIHWITRGDAVDLVGSIRAKPSDPRNAGLAEIEEAISRLETALERRDVHSMVDLGHKVDGLCRKLKAAEFLPLELKTGELAPLVKAGRKNKRDFMVARAEANRIRRDTRAEVWSEWQKEANEFWSRRPAATKSQVAHHIITKAGLDKRQHKTVTRRIKKVGQAS